MQVYEAEFQYILRNYLALINRIEKWQKSIPPNPQITDKGFGMAQQFRLVSARPSFVFDKLDYVEKNMGGLNKFISVIPVVGDFVQYVPATTLSEKEVGNNPSQDETAKKELKNERRNKKPVGRPRKR